MISKSILTLEGVRMADDMNLFVHHKQNGEVDWSQTRGSITVFCNKSWVDGEGKTQTQSDAYEINVSGIHNICTLATHGYKGKMLDRVVAYVRHIKTKNGNKRAVLLDQDGNEVFNKKNGQKVFVDIPAYHLQSVELGADSENYEAGTFKQALENGKAQGIMPPNLDVEATVQLMLTARRVKPKNKQYDQDEVNRTGKFGNANVWVHGRGWITPGGGNTTPQPQINSSNPDFTGWSPEAVQAYFEMVAKKSGTQQQQTQASAPEESPEDIPRDEVSGTMAEDEIPF